MKKWVGFMVASLSLVTTLGVPSMASAKDGPWTGFVPAAPDTPPPADLGPGTVLYFRREGGHYVQGSDDSRQNRNIIGTGDLTPFQCGDTAWQQVMQCLRETYGPFNVVVTDVDPGNSPHIETVVAGLYTEIGSDPDPNHFIGGIAPLGCFGGIDNAVTFAFANTPYMGCDPDWICWTAAQETAHAFGLAHEIDCATPMTYEDQCGTHKRFKDELITCGTDDFNVEACNCTGAAKQNSVQALLSIFGAGVDDAPSAQINKPINGATVQPGFNIEIGAFDDQGIARVELYIDAQKVAESTVAPYFFFAPGTLTEGNHSIIARVIDSGDHTVDSAPITVMLKPPCTGNTGCNVETEVCDNGTCIPGPGQPGGLGSTCTDSTTCGSMICASGPDGMRCTDTCVPGGTDCPDGFDCLAAGGSGACWPTDDVLNPPDPETEGCGCRAGGASRREPLLGFGLAFLAAAFVVARRRR
jgi:MYXO-CTERM domain-containing protein